MEKKNNMIFEKEDQKVEIMPKEKNSSFKNSIIEGNGSESSLKSIKSEKEMEISSKSSLNPVGISNNSISNENNKINNKNEQNSSSNNINHIEDKEDLTGSLSKIENLSGSSNEISDILKIIGNEKEDTNFSHILDSVISSNNSNENNSNNNMNDNDGKKNNEKEELLNSKIANNNINNNMEFKKEVKEMIKKGYIPFFMKAKGFNHVFYYGKPHYKFRTVIEQFIKKVNGFNKIKNEFYYKNKLIDLDSTLGELKIKPLSIISDEIK